MKSIYNIYIFITVFIIAVWLSLPTLLNQDKTPKINLGLDLKGGLYVMLEVDKKDLLEKKIQNLLSSVNLLSNKEDILIENLEKEEKGISFKLYDNTNENKTIISNLIKEEGVSFREEINEKENFTKYDLSLTEDNLDKYLEDKLSLTIQIMRNRLNEFGLSEPTVLKNGKDRIIVEIAGVNNQEDEKRIINLLTKPSYLQFLKVENTKTKNSIQLEDLKNKNILYDLNPIAILDGSYLENANIIFGQNNRIEIAFELNSQGAELFREFTSKNKGERVAIVIDNVVYSAPTIQATIGRNGTITGNFSMEEAKDLSIGIKSGSSGIKIDVLEKRIIGASLGEDSIKHGAISLFVGFILVLLYIIYYYRLNGLIISFALFVNLFLIISIMAILNATLTLAGIVGIVLTVGMAIDSNIIINERIKELLEEGKSMSKAIEEGYEKAFTTILDSNITTLLASAILYAYGNSTIKGFALTLSLGIIFSMFTSIYGTKHLILFFQKRQEGKK